MEDLRRQDRLWSIILADDQEDSAFLIEQGRGIPTPIPYCTVVGTRSVLQHTFDRADRLSKPDRRVTVASRVRRKEAWNHLGGRSAGMVVSQPAHRGTAAGVFLALTYVRARDPRATVVIYPASQFVHPELRFVEAVEQAVCAANRLADRVILLGVHPEHQDRGYSWILPGEEVCWTSGRQVRYVESFRHPCPVTENRSRILSGALWHTGIIAAQVDTLWGLGERCFPQMTRMFGRLTDTIGTLRENWSVATAYQFLPEGDFLTDLLIPCRDSLGVMRMGGVLWSDWADPLRIRGTLERLDMEPLYPLPLDTSLIEVGMPEDTGPLGASPIRTSKQLATKSHHA